MFIIYFRWWCHHYHNWFPVFVESLTQSSCTYGLIYPPYISVKPQIEIQINLKSFYPSDKLHHFGFDNICSWRFQLWRHNLWRHSVLSIFRNRASLRAFGPGPVGYGPWIPILGTVDPSIIFSLWNSIWWWAYFTWDNVEYVFVWF